MQLCPKFINVAKLKIHVKTYPQSLFILKTSYGLRSQNYCLRNNVAGSLLIKIN